MHKQIHASTNTLKHAHVGVVEVYLLRC